ncbi:MAG: START domain-containing protein [Bacteroidales bacterium]|nr:START domain-containing protein [Bacteroidales bacterium]
MRLAIIIISLWVSSSDYDWTLVRSENNIEIYQRKVPSEKIYQYKAKANIVTSVDSLYHFFLDFDGYHRWIPNCVESKKILSNSQLQFVYYSRYDLPWPFSDRDAYSHIIIKQENNKYYITSQPYTAAQKRLPGVIRVNEYYEEYLVQPVNDSLVTLKMSGRYNPGGYIPAWLANKFIKYGPYDVIQSIRREMKNE